MRSFSSKGNPIGFCIYQIGRIWVAQWPKTLEMGLFSGNNNFIGQLLKGLKVERTEKRKTYSENRFAENKSMTRKGEMKRVDLRDSEVDGHFSSRGGKRSTTQRTAGDLWSS